MCTIHTKLISYYGQLIHCHRNTLRNKFIFLVAFSLHTFSTIKIVVVPCPSLANIEYLPKIMFVK